ncbi:MAG: hypothetical protein MJZ50_04040 [Treponema sp.]|nr:hypothetical protein [Treponema sp.]
MKRIANHLRTLLLASLAALPLLSTLSCDIGLGESVDTEAPVLSIDYPKVGVVIRDSFVLKGTWSDDKSLASLQISVQGTGLDNQNFALPPENVMVNPDGSWYAVLNDYGNYVYNGWQIPDGPIQINVVATDNGGHQTVVTHSVEIDNTPPVLILAKPLSTGTEQPSTFGRIVKLTGDLYDMHQSNGIKVSFGYAPARGNSITGGTSWLEGFTINSSMTDDTPLIIAQYSDAASVAADPSKAPLRTNYLQLYGSDADNGAGKTQDKTYYCTVRVSDSAKVYKNPGDDGTGEGNTASTYYINSNSFYNYLQSDKYGKNYDITATKIAKLMNGTFNEPGITEDDKKVIWQRLAEVGNSASCEELDARRSSKMLINPDNSPTWNVSDYAVNAGIYNEYSNGAGLYVNVNAGKDGTLLLPETVRVVLKHKDATGNQDLGNIVLCEEGAWGSTDASASLSNSYQLTTGRSNHLYIFEVTGKDRDGNDIVAQDGNTYGFSVKQTSFNPSISPKETDSFYTASVAYDSGILIEGTVEFSNKEDLFDENNPIEVKIEVGSKAPQTFKPGESDDVKIEYFEADSDNNIPAKWSIRMKGETAKPSPSQSGDIKTKVQVTIKDNSGQTQPSTAKVEFFIKNNVPVISFDSDANTYNSGSGILGSRILIKGTANAADNQNNNITLTGPAECTELKFETPADPATPNVGKGKWSAIYKVPTTEQLAGKSGKTSIQFTAKDEFGPSTTSAFDFNYDNVPPTVKITSIDPYVVDANDSSKNYINGKVTVSGTARDSGDIKKIVWEALQNNTVVATDTIETGELTNFSFVVDTKASFVVDTKASEIADETPVVIRVTAYDNAGHDVDASGAIVDKDGNAGVATTGSASHTRAYTVSQKSDLPRLMSANFALGKAEENLGTTSSDADKPNIFGTSDNNNLTGTIKDDDGIALVEVFFKEKDADWPERQSASTTDKKYYRASGNNETFYSMNVPVPAVDGIIYEVKVVVTDKNDTVDNTGFAVYNSTVEAKGGVAKQTFIGVSNGAPDLTIDEPNGGFKTGSATIKTRGVVTGNLLKLERIIDGNAETIYTSADGAVTPSTMTGADATNTRTWTDEFTGKPNDGNNYVVQYRATNQFQQTSTVKYTYKVDTTAPTNKIDTANSIDNKAFVGESSIRGSATDPNAGSSGVNYVYYQVVDINGTQPAKDANNKPSAPYVDATTTNGWTQWPATGAWSIPLEFVDYVNASYDPSANGGKFQEGRYNFWVYATDGAGNVSYLSSIRFDVNLHEPVLDVKVIEDTTTDEITADQINRPFRFGYTVSDTYKPTAPTVEVVELYKGSEKLASTAYALDTTNKVVTINSIASETSNAPTGYYTSDGTYYITLKATDAFTKAVTVTSKKITIDRTKPAAPVISTPGVDDNGNALWLNSKDNFNSNGTATDPNSGTGVKTVWFAKNGATQPDLPAAADFLTDSAWEAKTWKKATGTQSWSSPVSGLDDGENIAYIYVAAVDNAGNVSDVASRSISVDTTPPELKNITYKLGADVDDDSKAKSPFTENSFNSKFNKFALYGDYSDDISKVEITATCNGQAYDPTKFVFTPTPASGTDKSGTWVLKTNGTVSDGEYRLSVKATDKANNSVTVTKTVVVDTIAPEIGTFKYPTYSSTSGQINTADTRAENYTLTGKITESGAGLVDTMTLTFFDKPLQPGYFSDSIVKNPVDKNDPSKGYYADIPANWDYENAKTDASFAKRTITLDAGQNWNETVSYASNTDTVFAAEGEKAVALEVFDNAGNKTVVIKNFTYDKALPTLTPKWDAVPTFMPNGGITIKGLVEDSYLLRQAGTVVVREKFNDVASTPLTLQYESPASSELTEVVAGKKYNIEVKIPLNGATVQDGTYTYNIEVYDSVGNVFNSQTYNLVADLAPPSLTIKTPSSDTSAKGVGAINVTNYRFEGESEDGSGTTSSGVTTVFYKIDKSETVDMNQLYKNSTTTNGWSTSVNGTPQSWNISQKFKESSADSSVEGLPEGTYYLHAYCVDKAGNYSYDHETTKNVKDGVATRAFDVDLHNPTLETKLDGVELTKNTVETITDPAKKFTFFISDTYGLDSTAPYTFVVKQTKTGQATKTLVKDTDYTITAPASPDPDGTYKYEFAIKNVDASGKDDALYEITVTAKDAFGKTTTAERSIRLDTQAPVLGITSHNFDDSGNSDWITGINTFSVKGTAEDDSGVVAVWYKNASSAALPTLATGKTYTDDSVWTGWTKTTGAANWTISSPTDGYADGLNSISFTAVDKNGLATPVFTRVFRVDKDAPAISGAIKMSKWDSTAASGAGAYATPESLNDKDKTNTNVKFKLEGTVTDAYQLAGLKLEAFKGSDVAATYTLVDDQNNANHLTMTKTSDKSWSWSYVFDPKDSSKPLADGLWNFKLTATDAGGQTAVQTNKIVVDTLAPAAAIDYTIDSAVNFTDASSGNKWYKSNQVTISLKAADTTGADEVTGVASVEYTTDASTWTPLAKVSGEYKGSVTVSNQGVNAISIRITDNAGNVNASAGTLNPYVDTKSPGVPTGVTVDGESNVATKLVNGKNDVVVVMTGIADYTALTGADAGKDASGIGASSVNLVKIGGTTLATPIAAVADASTPPVAGKYTLTIPKDKIASGQCTLEISDNVGNKTDYIPFTFDLDNVAPTVELIAPSDADKKAVGTQVNASITVSGSTNDNKALESKTIGTGAAAITIGSPVFYYTDTQPSGVTTATWSEKKSGWTKLAQSGADVTIVDTTNCYSWVTNAIDTTNAGGVFTDETPYWLIAEVTDTALNTGVSNIVEFKVSQDTDRPIVKNTNLNNNGTDASPTYILSFGTLSQIEGSVEDDDSTSTSAVKAFFATEKAPKSVVFNADVTEATVTYSDDSTEKFAYLTPDGVWQPDATNTAVVSGKTTFDAKSGDYIYQPKDTDDGQKSVWFVVRDNNDKVFWTAYASATPAAASDKFKRPKFQHKTSAAGDSAAVFTYKVDGANPTVSGTSMSAKDSAGNDVDFSNGSATDPVKTTAVQDNVTLGGPDREKATFSFSASDANGIAGMTLEMTFTGKFRKTDGTEEEKTVTKKFATAATIGSKFTADSTYTVSGSMIQQKANPVPSDPYTWTLDELILHGANSIIKETDAESVACYGNIKFVVTAYDTCGNYSNNTYQCALDNVGPTINIFSPDSTTANTGDVLIMGSCYDNGNAGVTTLDYKVNATGETYGGNRGGTFVAWSYKLDGTENPGFNAKNADGSYKYLNSTVSSETSTGSDIWDVPVYFKAVDALGNVTEITNYTVRFDPNGNKPTVRIITPKLQEGASSIILGGTVGVTGSSDIPSRGATAEFAYLQIEHNTAAAGATPTWTAYDKLYLEGYGYTYKQYSDYTTDNRPDGIAAGWWGVESSITSNSWSYDLNKSGEFDPTGDASTHIRMRACAKNDKNQIGAWTEWVEFFVDNKAPKAKSISLQQFSNYEKWKNGEENTLTRTNYASYEPGKYLRGQWYIVLDVEDENGLNASTIELKCNGINLTASDYAKKETTSAANVEAHKNYTFYIPVSSSDGVVTYKFSVKDWDSENIAQAREYSAEFQFNIDNKKPAIDTENGIKGNGSKLDAAFKHISDSNYSFTLNGKVTEAGSGLKRTLFYFVRDGKREDGNNYTTPAYLDPVRFNGKTVAGKTALADATNPIKKIRIKDNSNDGSNDFYVYGRVLTGSQPNAGNASQTADDRRTFTVSVGTDSHIRTGGLVFFGAKTAASTANAPEYTGGRFIRLNSVDAASVTLEEETDGQQTEAVFIYGQMVDNTYTESISSKTNDYLSFNSEYSDDSDGIHESIENNKPNYTWNATFKTTNLEDGPVKLVCLVFDAAGNVSSWEQDVFVANNQPRIAKVYLGTDLDRDGKFTDAEFAEYSWYGAEGLVTTKTLTTGAGGKTPFAIKKDLAIVPEVVGGNGDISMVYKKGATTADPVTSANKTANGTAVDLTAADSTIKATFAKTSGMKFDEVDKVGEWKAFTLDNAGLNGGTAPTGNDDGDGKKMSFTFWDSTAETTSGTDSMNAVLYVDDFTVDLVDKYDPNVVVNRFFWTSKSHNSLYMNGTLKDADGNEVRDASDHVTPTGHMEILEVADLLSGTTGYTANAPKVSGKIVVRGTAYDNVSLKSLTVNFGSISNAEVATYASGKWTVTKKAEDFATNGYYFVVYDHVDHATGDGNDAVNLTADISSNYFTKSGVTGTGATLANLAYFGQEGHKVAWELVIDTENAAKILGGKAAALNQLLTVVAKDSSGRLSSGDTHLPGTHKEGKHEPTYAMDVVPYVTNITTSLSTLDESVPTAHSRSALGRYSVRADENVVIEGFNLGTNKATVTDGVIAAPIALVRKKVNADDTDDSDNVLSIGALKTGKITVTVDGVNAVNNVNDNDAGGKDHKVTAAQGDETTYTSYYYNRQPNGYNNNRLTDDLEIAVWEIDNDAVDVETGMALQPIMKINPKDDKVGFAFMDGALHYALPRGYRNGDNTETNSYERWIMSFDFFSSVGFTFDSEGHSWGVGAGGDINTTVGDTYHLSSSQWLPSSITDRNAGHNGANLVHMDQIGITRNSQNIHVKQRFKSSSLATTVHGKSNNIDSTNVYVAYFDSIANEIRFKAGTNSYTNSGDFSKNNSTYYKNNNTNSLSALKTAETQAIAKTGVTGRGAGQYVSIAAIPGSDADKDVVVAVWYDASARTMRYSYNTSPLEVSGRAGNAPTSATPTPSGWSVAVPVFSGKQKSAGEYCQIAVDKNGGIHIAAYDPQNLDLVYAYASGYNQTFSTCVVDSSGVVGDKLTIDVAYDSADGNPIPYIGYYATSSVRPKYAYKVASSSLAPIGTVSDKVTGNWESIVVATNSTINHEANGQHNKINVGVWKTSDGVIKNSSNSANTCDLSKHKGNVYGNGSKNAIIGYAIDLDGVNGNIETAQLRQDKDGN